MAYSVELVTEAETAEFFDEMAPRYDSDLIELGWDPCAMVRGWPFVVPPGSDVLDAGCGTGALLEEFSGAARALSGFDLAPQMVARARRRSALRGAELRVSSVASHWPFSDDAFDRVISLAMLEFVEELDAALSELARVLRPGGRALVSVEDVRDAGGLERELHERRYGCLDLWRRSRAEFIASVPPDLEVFRVERVNAYTVLERGFTCAYHVAELIA